MLNTTRILKFTADDCSLSADKKALVFILSCFILLFWFTTSVYADETININCEDYTNPNTCEISPNNQFLTSVLKTIDVVDQCRSGLGNLTTVECNINVDQVTIHLTCAENVVGASNFQYTCTFDDTTEANCNINGNTASCDVNTNSDALIAQARGLGLTQPQDTFASTLITVCTRRNVSPSMQASCDNLLANLNLNDIAELTPDAASAPLNASVTSLRAQNINISLRMAKVRKDRRNRNSNSNEIRVVSNGRVLSKDELYPEDHLVGGGASADSTQFALGKLGLFMNGTINVGERDTSSNVRGFEFSGADLTGGMDYHFSDKIFSGIAMGLASNGTELKDNRGDLDLVGFNFIFYGSFYPTQASYLDGNLTFGGNNYEQSRNALGQVYDADYFGQQFSAAFSGGYDFTIGSLTLGPFGRLEYISSEVDEYRETSAGGGFSLNIDGQDVQSLTLTLGHQLTYVYSSRWGVMTPQFRFEWTNEFIDDVHVVEGHFIGDPTQTKFRLPTDRPDSSYFNLGLGISATFPDGTTGYFFYQSQLGFEDIHTSSFNLGGRWEF